MLWAAANNLFRFAMLFTWINTKQPGADACTFDAVFRQRLCRREVDESGHPKTSVICPVRGAYGLPRVPRNDQAALDLRPLFGDPCSVLVLPFRAFPKSSRLASPAAC